jgi:hypothetical protein
VERVFATLRNELGWVNRGTHHATRIHDLRHNSESRIIPSSHWHVPEAIERPRVSLVPTS